MISELNSTPAEADERAITLKTDNSAESYPENEQEIKAAPPESEIYGRENRGARLKRSLRKRSASIL